MTYRASVKDAWFRMQALLAAQTPAAKAMGEQETWAPDTLEAVLQEAARFAEQEWAPTNRPGDEAGVTLGAKGVESTAAARHAYQAFVDNGWGTLTAPESFGGQGMPHTLDFCVQEFLQAANMSLALCPMLTQATVEAISLYGSAQQKADYLPNLITGAWTGTMNLTEPQAGSDLSQVRMQAKPEGEHYRLKGQKIYITWGEHDLAPNTVHMVLARLPDAPPGVKGISLFLVPRVLLDEQGELGERNDVQCSSLEHKLGIHGSPTCVMNFGDHEGALGYLVGEPNEGLRLMFTMMNLARLAVGVQAIGVADRAYQAAVVYAKTRVQGRAVGGTEPVTIIHHPDVRRMLLVQRAQIEAMRALCMTTSWHLDAAKIKTIEHDKHDALAHLLVPLAKGWCTELSQTLVGQALQVHGGMGYIEETGVAQYLRDIRITTIYEGTTGIQAQDLVRRKVRRDEGATILTLLDEARASAAVLSAQQLPSEPYLEALEQLIQATKHLVSLDEAAALTVSVPYLMSSACVLAAHFMIEAINSLAFTALDAATQTAKRQSLAAFVTFCLPQASADARIVLSNTDMCMAFDEMAF